MYVRSSRLRECVARRQRARKQTAAPSARGRMLFRRDILQGIAEGRVTLAFRRWRRPPPADASSLRSPVGVLCLDRVTVVDEGDITTEDVRRTGLSLDELRASIAGEARSCASSSVSSATIRVSPPGTPAGARRARGHHREAGQGRRRVPDPLDDALPAADRPPAGHRLACARAAGRRRRAAVQASRPAAERTRPHRESRGRLPPVAARPCGTRVARQPSALKQGLMPERR